MLSRLLFCCVAIIGTLWLVDATVAQQLWPSAIEQPSFGNPQQNRGPGAYFAWYKLVAIILVYLPWTLFASRVNHDLLKWGNVLGMSPSNWNSLIVGSFVLAFFLTITIPWFWATYPFLVIAAVLPPYVYRVIRNGKVKSSDTIRFQMQGGAALANSAPTMQQDLGPTIEFTPAGEDADLRKKRLILARQSPSFVTLKEIVARAAESRADLVMLDYTQGGVAARMQVDGAWHLLPNLEREVGDPLLVSLKHLAGLNPVDRKNRQVGMFRYKWAERGIKSAGIEVTSQGIPTGERVIVKLLAAISRQMNLGELGMLEPMQESLKDALNKPGIVIISAPPQMGLTSTWRAALDAADRMTRDCVAIAVEGENETEMENLDCKRFAPGQSPAHVMRAILLKQPDMLVVPDVVNASSLGLLIAEANDSGRSITLRASAQNAAEAWHKLFQFATEKEEFVQAVRAVTGQRLMRRLCEGCRVSIAVKPEIIQRLGGDPRKQNSLWSPFVPPPPDQPILGPDGKPIEIQPCPQCSGFGYLGRIAAFELLTITDPLRQAILSGMPPAKLEQLAIQQGFQTMLQNAYQMVLYGVTSIAEVQRVFKPAEPAKPVARKM